MNCITKKISIVLTLFIVIFTLSSFKNEAVFVPTTSLDYVASDYGNIVSKTTVYDKYNNPRFLLYLYSNDGYAIYDTLTNDYLERSNVPHSSPYDQQSGKYYYLGLNSYAVQENNEYVDIYSNEPINLSSFEDIPIIQNISNVHSINKQSIPASYEVPFANYFKALDGYYNYFPENTDGDCGYVAASILLSYLAVFYNSDIICEHYMNIADSNYVEDSWNNVSCATLSFKNNLLKEGVTNNASTAISVSNAVTNYINNYSHVNFTPYTAFLTPTFSIQNIVRDGFPVIIFSNIKDLTNNKEINSHAVVAYGISSNNRLIAHLGHTNRSNVEISNTAIGISGSIYYIDVDTIAHKHSNYYKLENTAYCLKCNISSYYNPYPCTYTKNNSTYHNKMCGCCGDSFLELHNFTIKGDFKVCTKCQFSIKADNPFNPGEFLSLSN